MHIYQHAYTHGLVHRLDYKLAPHIVGYMQTYNKHVAAPQISVSYWCTTHCDLSKFRNYF